MVLALLIAAGLGLLGCLYAPYTPFRGRELPVDRWRREQAIRERARRIYR